MTYVLIYLLIGLVYASIMKYLYSGIIFQTTSEFIATAVIWPVLLFRLLTSKDI